MAAYIAQVPINGKSGPNQTPIAAAMHNLRAIAAELKGRPGDRINPRRSHLNQVLKGPSTPADIVTLMDEHIANAGAKVIRKDQIKLFEVVIAPKQFVADQDAFFVAAMHWMENQFACPLISAVVHLDEEEPHMHLLFVPLRDGRLQGDAVMGRKVDLMRRNQAFQAEIGARFRLTEKRQYKAAERTAVANAVIAKLASTRSLPADAWHQLKKAVSTAGNFEGLCLAFGIGNDAEPVAPATIPAQPAEATPPPATPIGVQMAAAKLNPYQCVGFHSPALRELYAMREHVADWEGVQEQFEERAAIAEHDGGMTRSEAEQAALLSVQSMQRQTRQFYCKQA